DRAAGADRGTLWDVTESAADGRRQLDEIAEVAYRRSGVWPAGVRCAGSQYAPSLSPCVPPTGGPTLGAAPQAASNVELLQKIVQMEVGSGRVRAQPEFPRGDVPGLDRPRPPSGGSDRRRPVEQVAMHLDEVDIGADAGPPRVEQRADPSERGLRGERPVVEAGEVALVAPREDRIGERASQRLARERA